MRRKPNAYHRNGLWDRSLTDPHHVVLCLTLQYTIKTVIFHTLLQFKLYIYFDDQASIDFLARVLKSPELICSFVYN